MNGKIKEAIRILLVFGIITVISFGTVTALPAQTDTGFVYPTGTKGPYLYCGWLSAYPEYPFDGYYHIGQDMEANVETNIYAIADGEIIYVDNGDAWNFIPEDKNYGIFVKHKSNNGKEFVALYGHIRPINIDLMRNGKIDPPVKVYSGVSFATIGPFGSIPHLHFGIYPGLDFPLSNWGRMPIGQPGANGFVDPMEWITTKRPFQSKSSKSKPKETSITVTSPNGGEVWPAGSMQTIKWSNSTKVGNSLSIDILKNGNVVNGFCPAQNTGSASWTIPEDQIHGNDYRIRITDTVNTNYNDTSDSSFTVSAYIPPLKLTTITVSPPTATVEVGSGQKFTATTLDQNGDPIDAVIAWSVENPAVGSIDAAGNFIGALAGTTKIIASNGSIFGNATVEVTHPAPIGGPVHNVNKNTDYTTIQGAISDASIGDEIDVYSGTYPESLNIAMEQIHIKGIDTGAGKPIIDNGVTGDTVTFSADQIIFEGFEIRRPMHTPYRGIYVLSSYNIIINNNVSLNDNGGIYLSSSNSKENLLFNNNVSNNGCGICLSGSSNNTLWGNNASGNGYGISLSWSSNNNTVNNNNVSNNNYGISVYICGKNKIYHNNFIDNSMQAYFEYDL